MARKSKRASRRHRRSHRRSHRSHGGVAPVQHVDAGWSSKMSLGQGGDYLKYHVGQHGGAALQGADLSVLGGEGLPSALRGAALMGQQDRALDAIRNMSDQLGGRRRSKRSHRHKRKSHRNKRKSHGGKRKSHRNKRNKRKRSTRRRGGAHHPMSYAPVTTPSMLLDSQSEYIKGGLSNEWMGPEVDAARARASL